MVSKIINSQADILKKNIKMEILFILFSKILLKGFPGGSVVKNLPASTGDVGSIPAWGGSHMPWGQWGPTHNCWVHLL